ncbi:protein RER1 [Trichuris trichiura]|uniref:Protein RER1 n=1 Tax=Trichuris trichiura TaxID=36087 RepID=A0A077ZJ16_TRITR|nr:protein RER1 [Trichuris trichiura]
MGLEEDEIVDKPHVLSRFYRGLSQRYQLFLDQWTPYTLSRWIATIVLGILFMCRIVHVQGFYIVTYALGIYHLNLLIAFLTPKIDPALELESGRAELQRRLSKSFSPFAENEDGPSLPTKSNEEFRPFMRRLPEFKFWHSATKSIIIAFICTFFEMFNVPVFWPILVIYFVILFCLTMKRQIKHMIKYRYVPFTTGKPRHAGKSVPVQSK